MENNANSDQETADSVTDVGDAAKLILAGLQKSFVAEHVVLYVDSGRLRVSGTTYMIKGWNSDSPDSNEESVSLRQADSIRGGKGEVEIEHNSMLPSMRTSRVMDARVYTGSSEANNLKYSRLISYLQDLAAGLDVSSLDAFCKNFLDGTTPGLDAFGRPQNRIRTDVGLIAEISQSLSALDQLDFCGDMLSVRVNIAYWRLGAAYRKFEHDFLSSESPSQADLARNPRQRNGLILAKLMKSDVIKVHLKLSDGTDDKALHAKVAQRLQRARKVYCMAMCLGLPILFYVPEMCITRIDKLSIVMLEAYLIPVSRPVDCKTVPDVLAILLRHIRSLLSSIDIESRLL